MGQFNSLKLGRYLRVSLDWGLKVKQKIWSFAWLCEHQETQCVTVKMAAPSSETRAQSPSKTRDVTGSKSLTNSVTSTQHYRGRGRGWKDAIGLENSLSFVVVIIILMEKSVMV